MDDLTNDQPVDDAALFSEVTGSPVPEITSAPAAAPATTPAAPAASPAAPAATPVTEPAIPPGRLREESEARRTAERERDDFKAQLEALKNPKPAPQPKAEVDPWADPKAFSKSVVDEALTPVQEQVRNVVFTYSKRDAIRDHGAEAVSAAETALEAAVRSGQVNGEMLAKQLSASLDPVGDVVKWHKRQSTLTKVGDDPDAFVKAEIEKMRADPARRAELLKMLQEEGQPQQPGTGAPLTELPGKPAPVSVPSLRNVGTSAAPAATNSNEPSDAELFASVTGRRR